MVAMLSDPISLMRARDRDGRTPLHVAAACEADPMVIKLLGSTNPATCTILDENSRTPLHLTCDTSCNLFQEKEDTRQQRQQRNAPSHDIICALLSDSIAATVVEDKDGMNALECAILSDASFEVVTLLQNATMESLRERENHR